MKRLRTSHKALVVASVLGLVAVGAACWKYAPIAEAQRHWDRGAWDALDRQERTIFPGNEFTFCRLRYTSYGESAHSNIGGRWSIDYPESDRHFSWRISELTTLDVPKDEYGHYKHAVVSIDDDALFDYPFVYMIEPGWLEFRDEKQAGRLRDYLLRGGFMMVDDFWGEAEWRNFEAEMSRVLDPLEYPIVDLDLEHPVFHMVFDLDEKPQVTTPWHWANGQTTERADAPNANYRGIHDKRGRLMVMICHNTDLGDGWEREGEFQGYFDEVSAKKAYPMGINIVVYAMTH